MTDIDLQSLGLATKWPRLLKLQRDLADFQTRHERKCLTGERRAKVEADLMSMVDGADGDGAGGA